MSFQTRGAAILGLAATTTLTTLVFAQTRTIPKTWDDQALSDWATPLATLNARPGHLSEKEYYAAPVDNLRTYPVYYPGREPSGYWDKLQTIGPKPLVEPEKLKSDSDWIAAGKRVFDELDGTMFRRWDQETIEFFRSKDAFRNADVLPDGRVPGLLWVPTERGIAISIANCSACHTRYLPGGQPVPGAVNNLQGGVDGSRLFLTVGASPIPLPGDTPGMQLYREYGVPWLPDDVHARFKKMEMAEIGPLLQAAFVTGVTPRWSGSPYYMSKVPDLIGLKDRKYIDHTATHKQRNIGDLMRYAALVSYAEATEFGPYQILDPKQPKIYVRSPDEALYALALYIYSLEPPPNPNRFDERANAGEKIFKREGCTGCHTPPLYTNNKLTLAKGFQPPNDSHSTDIMPLSVGTDPGLALKTRKGTGYYKVPSLKGVWYRGRYLHDGTVASLEEMFDPGRLSATHVPGGWKPPGSKIHAIVGHEFGLKLTVTDRRDLIAFLRTL
jgi:hypothetical protein